MKKITTCITMLLLTVCSYTFADKLSENNGNNAATASAIREPVKLSHTMLLKTQFTDPERSTVFKYATDNGIAPLSPTINAYLRDDTLEINNLTFYLDGGKTYYLDGNDNVTKGFTLRTNPDDVAKGLRAKVVCGLGVKEDYYNGAQMYGPYHFFMIGKMIEEGATTPEPITIGNVVFQDIDFDNPLAQDYGTAGNQATGSYFINTYSTNVPCTLNGLIINNCTFQRFIRGFIRESSLNSMEWKKLSIDKCLFYNCGYYNFNIGGYYFLAATGSDTKSTIFRNLSFTNNTIYDAQYPSFMGQNSIDNFDTEVTWNVNISGNTFINFGTRGTSAYFFNFLNMPGGSTFTVKNNLFSLLKQEGDTRSLFSVGAKINKTSNPEAMTTLDFSNNRCTNDNLTDGQYFTNNTWSNTDKGFGSLLNKGIATLVEGGSLEVNALGTTAASLFTKPYPPHKAVSTTDPLMHSADAIDGNATTEYTVNLYRKTKFPLAAKGIGDTRWHSLPVKGDFTGDRVVDKTDVDMLTNIYLGHYDIYKANTDINNDGKITVEDANDVINLMK